MTPPTKPLTARQAEVLAFVRKFIAEYGWPPSMREIADAFGSRNQTMAGDHLWAIARKGYIHFGPMGQSRAYRVLFDETGRPVARPGDAS